MRKLENYLKEKFSGTEIPENKSYGSQLAEAMIGRSIGGFSFDVPETFDIFVSASEEEMKSAIKEFYLENGYVMSKEKKVEVADMSFENANESIFVTLSSFDTFFKISITTFEKINVFMSSGAFIDKGMFPDRK